jgi:hypothetical protein
MPQLDHQLDANRILGSDSIRSGINSYQFFLLTGKRCDTANTSNPEEDGILRF